MEAKKTVEEVKEPKVKHTSCIGCKNAEQIGPNAYRCTAKNSDHITFKCYK